MTRLKVKSNYKYSAFQRKYVRRINDLTRLKNKARKRYLYYDVKIKALKQQCREMEIPI